MYEYKVIPAPLRTIKVKGLKTPAERFAHLLEGALNAEVGEGWEFVRAETLPCEERKGLTGTAKSFQSVLVFRRATGFADAGYADAEDTATDYAEFEHPETDDTESAQDQPDSDRPAPLATATATATATDQAPRLSLVAKRHDPETRPPLAGHQPAAQTARQEPVLRPGAARHGVVSERPEPVLRTRALDEDGNQN